jgi:hypothetical protein
MIGKSTSKRLASGVALAALAAALAVPTALGGVLITDTLNSAQVAKQNTPAANLMERHYKHEDAVYGAQPAYQVPAGFATDTLNSARVARSQPQVYRLPNGFQTDTVNSSRIAPVVESPVTSGGFDWSSFGIGMGAGIGGLLLLGAVAAGVRPLRRLANA